MNHADIGAVVFTRRVTCFVVACLVLVAAAVLRAGDQAATNGASASQASTNSLQFWADVPANRVRSEVLPRADMGTTNRWLSSGLDNALATSATWRATAEVEIGYFHARRGGCSADGHRSVDGWFQEAGAGLEWNLDSMFSFGVGVSVGRATVR